MTAFLRANAGLVAVGLIGIAILISFPLALDTYTLLQLTLYAIFSILALSLAFIWGYGGILCFGHSAFFGLGAYTYAVAVINMGESTGALLLAMALPAVLAAGLHAALAGKPKAVALQHGAELLRRQALGRILRLVVIFGAQNLLQATQRSVKPKLVKT